MTTPLLPLAGIDLSDQNFDSPLGRRSLRRMYDHVVQDSVKLPVGVSLVDIRKDTVLGAAVRGSAARTRVAVSTPALILVRGCGYAR